LQLEQGSMVEIRQEQGRLILVPLKPLEPTLDDLLEAIKPENLHTEIDTGPAAGAEVW
jgi:antitoxin MazE